MDVNDFLILLEEDDKKKKRGKGDYQALLPLKRSDLKVFSEGLSRLLTGGIPILRALEALRNSAEGQRFKGFLGEVSENIRQGMSFKEALESTKSVPVFFSQIAYAGEISGATPTVLIELAKYLEKEEVLKRKIQEALAYPLLISAMGLATLGVLLQVVIPKLATLYKDFGAELPIITKTVLVWSQWSLPFFAILTFIGGVFLFLLFRKKETVITIFYETPFLGRILKMILVVQFARLFSLLLESGVVILEALEIISKTLPSFIAKDIRTIKKGIGDGRSFSDCLETVKWMDGLSKMLVASGEESGRMPESFTQIAADTEVRLETQIQILMKLLDPSLILGIGLIVGFVVIGTVLPIFDISGLVQ